MSLHGRQGAAGGQQGRQAGLCRGGRWAWGDAGPGGPRTCTGARPQGRPRPVPALLGLGARQARRSGGATSLTLAALAPLSLASTSTPQSAGPPTHPLPAPQAPPTPLRRGMRVPLGRPVRPHTTGFSDLGRTAAWALVRPLGRWEPRPRPLGPGRLMPLNTSEGLCIQPTHGSPEDARPAAGFPATHTGLWGGRSRGTEGPHGGPSVQTPELSSGPRLGGCGIAVQPPGSDHVARGGVTCPPSSRSPASTLLWPLFTRVDSPLLKKRVADGGPPSLITGD